MNCKKCHKEIPDGSIFCNWCGKKQESTKRKKARRPKGMGSIWYRADRKSPYLVFAPRTANVNGKYLGAYKDMKSAQAALDCYFNDITVNYSTMTVQQIYDEWSKVHFQTLTRNGEQGYKTAYKYLDSLYSRKMCELKTADFQRCIDKCAQNFSRSQCEKVKQICSQLCKYAMQNDIIDKNYAEFLKLPKQNKKEKEIFTDNELNLLWQHSDDERVQIILIMCYTGFRIGEMCNIKKTNVNIEEGYIIAGEKTKAGIDRMVPIFSDVAPFIKNLYTQSTSGKLIDMNVKTLRNNIFYSALSDLKFIDPPTKNPKTNKLEYKNPRLTPHCTRHTFATLCVNAGLSAKKLQKIIGHAKFETTADIYVHEDFNSLKKEIEKLKQANDNQTIGD